MKRMMDKEPEKDVRTSWGLIPVCPSATWETLGKLLASLGSFLKKLLSNGRSPLELYIYVCVCVCVCVYTHIYTHTHTYIYTQTILLFAILLHGSLKCETSLCFEKVIQNKNFLRN